jgi:hypothetical protein
MTLYKYKDIFEIKIEIIITKIILQKMSKCYISDDLIDYYKSVRDEPFPNKKIAVKSVLSVYLHYRCVPNEDNDFEPQDPVGLGIIECIILKLIQFPEYSKRMRLLFEQIDNLLFEIVSNKISLEKTLHDTFTLDQLRSYGF